MDSNSMKKVLVIEDDQNLLPVFKKQLDQHYNVKIATNGDEGLDLANSFEPDFIILDLVLPGSKSGMHVLMELKKLEATRKIPVMVLTNLEGQTQLALENGAIKCLIKTDTTFKSIVDTIREFVDNKKE